MLQNFIVISLLAILTQVSTATYAQPKKTMEDTECQHPLHEPVQVLIEKQFEERSISVGEDILVDLREAIVAATCDATKRAIERIGSGNIPEGGITSVEDLPFTSEIAKGVTERVSLGIIEDGHFSRIDALALSITFGVNALLRNDSRKYGFVEVECPNTGNNEGFRISDDETTCDKGLVTLIGSPALTLYSSGKDICTGEVSVKRGQTVVCRCEIVSNKPTLMCRN